MEIDSKSCKQIRLIVWCDDNVMLETRNERCVADLLLTYERCTQINSDSECGRNILRQTIHNEPCKIFQWYLISFNSIQYYLVNAVIKSFFKLHYLSYIYKVKLPSISSYFISSLHTLWIYPRTSLILIFHIFIKLSKSSYSQNYL